MAEEPITTIIIAPRNNSTQKRKLHIIPLFSPFRGCTYRCVFCNQRLTGYQSEVHSWSAKSTLNRVYKIVREIRARTNSQAPPPIEVAFYGGSFTGLSSAAMDTLLQPFGPLLKKRIVSGIRISTRPDILSQEQAFWLRERGVTTIELGVPSFDREVLKVIGRKYEPDVIAKSTAFCKKAHISVGFQLMYGLPNEGRKSRHLTIAQTITLKPHFVRVHPTIVLKGAPLEKLFQAGKFVPLTLAQAVVIAGQWAEKLQKAEIPVIRWGLQPVDSLVPGDTVIAGPYHPAFGELVRSYIARQQIKHALREKGLTKDMPLIIKVPSHELSQFKGLRKMNERWLKRGKIMSILR